MPVPCGITTETMALRVLSGAAAGVYPGPWNAGTGRWEFGVVGGYTMYLAWSGSAWELTYVEASATVGPDSAGCGPFLAVWNLSMFLDGFPQVEASLGADATAAGLPLVVNRTVACGLVESYPAWPDVDVELRAGPVGTYRLSVANATIGYAWSAQIGGTDLYASYPAANWSYFLTLAYDPAYGSFRLILANYAGNVIYGPISDFDCNPLVVDAGEFTATVSGGPTGAGLGLVVGAAAYAVASPLPLAVAGLAASAAGLPLALAGSSSLTSGLPVGVTAGTGVGVGLYLRGNNPAAAGFPLVLTSGGPVTAGLAVTVRAAPTTPLTSGLPIFLHTGSEVGGLPLVAQSEGTPAGRGMPIASVGAAAAAGGLPLAAPAVGSKAGGLPVYARGW